MIGLVIPQLEDLWFREQLIGDEATMACKSPNLLLNLAFQGDSAPFWKVKTVV